MMTDAVSLSVVVPVTREVATVSDVYADYKEALLSAGHTFEMIFIVDGMLPQTIESLRQLKNTGEPIDIYCFEQPQGEAAALSLGFQHCRAETVMTLNPIHEIAIEDIESVLNALGEADMIVASRVMPSGTGSAVQERKLEKALRFLLGSSFRDVRCGVRVMKAAVAKELTIYGNQQRFLPLIAQTQGFSVREVAVRPSKEVLAARSAHSFDASLVLDIITIYFLLKFTKKPFRFFGGIGFSVLLVGGLITVYLVFMRLFFDVALVDRPALILSSLMVVLGIQIISVGLIGEIIAFSYAKDIKDYKIERIVE